MNRCDKRLRGAVIVALAGLAGACQDAPNTPVADDALTDLDADAVIYGMDDYLEQEGVRSGRIRADSAYAFNDSAVVKLWDLDMTIYHEDGRERARVTSERGTLHERTDRMVAQGNVVVQMAGTPERIESPELHYDPASDRIWSDSSTVRVLPDGRVTRGTCFRSDLELRNVTVCNIRGAAGGVAPGAGGDPGGDGGDGG